MIPHACADDRRGCRCAGWISAGAIMDYAQRIRDLAARKLKIDAVIEQPPDPAMGDYALPCFAFAKAARKSPVQLAQEFAKQLSADFLEKVEAKGPYVNFFLDKRRIINEAIAAALKPGYGSSTEKERILIEYPSPNTNKPLHLGHIRNILLGSTISSLSSYQGNDVFQVNLNNDRGVHICKSMLA